MVATSIDSGVETSGQRASLTREDPWRWLGAGWNDLQRAPMMSLAAGAGVVGGGVLITWVLWSMGLESLVPAAFGVFALVGPLLALCFYEMSRRMEQGQTPRLFPIAFAGPRSPLQVAYIGFFMLFAALVWVRIAMLLYALFTAGNYMPIEEFASFALTTGPGLTMITIGTVIGGLLAFGIYIVAVVSIPMLMNERTDAFSAISVGIRAFQRYPGTMALWAWIIAVVTAFGGALFIIGLAVAFPLLGHASWHAYRDIREVVSD